MTMTWCQREKGKMLNIPPINVVGGKSNQIPFENKLEIQINNSKCDIWHHLIGIVGCHPNVLQLKNITENI